MENIPILIPRTDKKERNLCATSVENAIVAFCQNR